MKIEKIEFEEKKCGRIFIMNPKENLSGIYLIFNKDMELIYIGQTLNLRGRIWAHVSKNNSSRKDNPERVDWKYSSKLKVGEAQFFSFVELEDKLEKDMLESSLIYIFKPKYNRYCAEFNEKLNEEID